jgi:hypothetical protein
MVCARGLIEGMVESELLAPLRLFLEERLQVIADHAFRERDAAAHLERLKQVSERLVQEHERLRGAIPPMLNHYLMQASYAKALDWIGEQSKRPS